MKKFAKLVMCTDVNNNKYYEMDWDGVSPTFTVKYGRVDSTASVKTYPVHQWDKKYNEKVNKGYRDKTHTVVEFIPEQKEEKLVLQSTGSTKVDNFLSLMKKYTDGLVSKTYKVKHQNVTQKQVDNAQNFLNELTKIDEKDITLVNSKLLELYMEIPRYMSKVQDYLLPNINLRATIKQEQDNLDAMASQVKMYNTKPENTEKAKKQTKTLLDLIGIEMQECTANDELDYLDKQLKGKRIESYFKVVNKKEDAIFDAWMAKQKNKETKIVIHGTKNTSVIPILEQGLKIRPTGNFQFTGKVYGNGNYFSEETNTSLGYTGYETDKVLLVYEVHVGKPYVYGSHPNVNLNYRDLQQHGFDCTYLKGSRGLNTMVIAYNEPQCKIKYIIWLK